MSHCVTNIRLIIIIILNNCQIQKCCGGGGGGGQAPPHLRPCNMINGRSLKLSRVTILIQQLISRIVL